MRYDVVPNWINFLTAYRTRDEQRVCVCVRAHADVWGDMKQENQIVFAIAINRILKMNWKNGLCAWNGVAVRRNQS